MNTHIKNSNQSYLSGLRGALAAAALGIASLSSMSPIKAQGPVIAPPMGGGWNFSDSRSSTLEEGVIKGQAQLTRSYGELFYLNSLAAVNYEQARKQAIENSVAYTKAYMERKEMREEYIKRYQRKPFVGEARERVIDYYRPKKLSASQYDSETGRIVWPHILRQAQYAPVRNEIDAIFANRTLDNSGNGSESQLEVKKLVKTFAALVRENLQAMSADQYIELQNFLRSVDAEAKIAVPATAANANSVDQDGLEGDAPAAESENPQARSESSKGRIEI